MRDAADANLYVTMVTGTEFVLLYRFASQPDFRMKLCGACGALCRLCQVIHHHGHLRTQSRVCWRLSWLVVHASIRWSGHCKRDPASGYMLNTDLRVCGPAGSESTKVPDGRTNAPDWTTLSAYRRVRDAQPAAARRQRRGGGRLLPPAHGDAAGGGDPGAATPGATGGWGRRR